MFRRTMTLGWLTSLTLFAGAWLPIAVWAQTPAAPELEQRVKQLESQVYQLNQQLLKQLETQKHLLEAHQGLVDSQTTLHTRQQSLMKQQQGLIDTQKSLTDANAAIRTALEEHRNLLANQLAQQQELLDSIAGWDESQQPYLRLDNIMAHPQGREAIGAAVNASLQQQGTLTINNRTLVEQQLLINRVLYRIPAGQSVRLEVPVGTVSTQLPGEGIVNWAITAPSYYQDVDIVEQETTRQPPLQPSINQPTPAPHTP